VRILCSKSSCAVSITNIGWLRVLFGAKDNGFVEEIESGHVRPGTSEERRGVTITERR